MRTKRLLSVLLAALLAIGVFGVIPASAMTFDEAIAAAEKEAAELAAQAASIGYPTGGIEIYPNSSLLGKWDATVLIWDMYARSSTSTPDSYDDLKKKTPPEASVKWEVWVYKLSDPLDPNSALVPDKKDVYTSEIGAALKDFVVYSDSTSTQERLYIKQGTTPYYGRVDIKMTLWVSGKTPDLVAEKTVILVDQTSFNNLLAEAQKILDKNDRYAKKYLEELTILRNAARGYLSSDPNVPDFKDKVAEATRILQAKIDDAENNYKLTDMDFINNLLPNGLKKFFWTMYDVIMTIIDFFNAISAIWKPLLNFGSALIKIFTAIFGIFSFLPLPF